MSKFKIPKQKTQHLENIIPTALFTSVHLLQTALLLRKQYQWYSEIFIIMNNFHEIIVQINRKIDMFPSPFDEKKQFQ